MTTTIFLVRHGQTKSNTNGYYMGRSDKDLTEVGYQQSRHLASRLAGLPVSSVYTSPLRRTRVTAEILAKPHGFKPVALDSLTEIALGDWQGLNMDEISRRWPDLWRQWRTDPSLIVIPDGESLPEVTKRTLPAFKNIVETSQDKQAVIVAHEVIVKVIVASVLGAPNSIYRRFEISNASLTVVHYRDGKPRLIGLNDTSHLSTQSKIG